MVKGTFIIYMYVEKGDKRKIEKEIRNVLSPIGVIDDIKLNQ